MKFMKLFSVLAIAGYIIFSSSVAAAQPNILFIVSDDHGWEICPLIGTIPKCVSLP